jgi:hypothetical protein
MHRNNSLGLGHLGVFHSVDPTSSLGSSALRKIDDDFATGRANVDVRRLMFARRK